VKAAKTLQREADELAERIASDFNIEERNREYAHLRVDDSAGSRPTVHLEDVSAIPFVENVSGVREYQHRARVRSGDGDMFVSVTQPATGYEEYCRKKLDLGDPEILVASVDENPLSIARSCRDKSILKSFERFARSKNGRITIHPYMAINDVWRLADELDDRPGMDVSVFGPTPPVLWIANDKSTMVKIVDSLLGSDYNVETVFASSEEEMTEELRNMAETKDKVGLKRTRCASAMGNIVFDSDTLLAESKQETLNRVESFLKETKWNRGERVLVVEWVDAWASPSTQMWIPPNPQNPIEMNGVYEQILKGPEKIFVGSRPTTLPDSLNQELADVSRLLARVFRRLGYSGRCSFDFVVTEEGGHKNVKLIECNGRWGGTSTPMHLVDRLFEQRPPYIATDYESEKLKGMTFPELKERLEGTLYDAETGEGRFILYNVGPLTDVGKFDIISIGESPGEAKQGIDEVLPERLGLK
jgi:hypothetical protein